MKLIFLDIDGVLTTNYRIINAPNIGLRFEPKAMRNLNALVEKTGAKVVIISQWRFEKTITKIKTILSFNGFYHPEEVLETYEHFAEKKWMRNDEIENFILMTEPDRFIIIDDVDYDYYDWQKENLISPDPETGFSDDDLDKAIQILNGDN